jgi:hypothetical protein
VGVAGVLLIKEEGKRGGSEQSEGAEDNQGREEGMGDAEERRRGVSMSTTRRRREETREREVGGRSHGRKAITHLDPSSLKSSSSPSDRD